MKKIPDFFKDDDAVEKIIGGFFGVIAIVAIFIEMFFNDFQKDAIVSGIKDISGTLITVVMLVVAIKALRPKKEEPFVFEHELKNTLADFVEKNKRMLAIRDIDSGNKEFYELYMESDFNAFFGDKAKLQPGWFMRMPPIDESTYAKEGLKMSFHLNQGTFFRHNKPENETEAYKNIGEKIVSLVLRETSEKDLICQYNKSKREIEVQFKKSLTTAEDVSMILKLIKIIYDGYLVLGVTA